MVHILRTLDDDNHPRSTRFADNEAGGIAGAEDGSRGSGFALRAVEKVVAFLHLQFLMHLRVLGEHLGGGEGGLVVVVFVHLEVYADVGTQWVIVAKFRFQFRRKRESLSALEAHNGAGKATPNIVAIAAEVSLDDTITEGYHFFFGSVAGGGSNFVCIGFGAAKVGFGALGA